MTDLPTPSDEGTAKFIPLRGEIVGLDFGDSDTEIRVLVRDCPPLTKQAVHLWVYTDLTAEELEAFDER